MSDFSSGDEMAKLKCKF